MEEQNNKPFRWCFIGTGRLGTQVAREITASGKHMVTSVYSRNGETRKQLAEQVGAKAYDTAEAAISAEDVDGVYVVTTHNAHYRFVKQALELGKPVLCEKAFTVTGEETEALIALAKEKGLYLCEAMWTWFNRGGYEVKKWLEDGEIGEVKRVFLSHRCNGVGYAPRVSDPARAGGTLLDISVYPLTFAYRLWGYPGKIESEGRLQNGADYEDHILLSYADGKTVEIRSSIDAPKDDVRLEIEGTKGRIDMPGFFYWSRAVCEREGKESLSFDYSHNTYLAEFDTAAAEIREGLTESRRVPLKATLDVMHIMDTVREQIGLVYDHLQ